MSNLVTCENVTDGDPCGNCTLGTMEVVLLRRIKLYSLIQLIITLLDGIVMDDRRKKYPNYYLNVDHSWICCDNSVVPAIRRIKSGDRDLLTIDSVITIVGQWQFVNDGTEAEKLFVRDVLDILKICFTESTTRLALIPLFDVAKGLYSD